MNILVVGRGGREHSIIMKLIESDQVTKIYAAPGNGGMTDLAECVHINETDIEGLVKFAKEQEIDFTIVGPELPLAHGISNRFAEEGLTVFGPTKEAALLEGSKQFAKEFMKRHEIPTADYATFTDLDKAKEYVAAKGAPIVVKADGLAGGKGVVVAFTEEEAYAALDDMLLSKKYSEAGSTVVIEEFLEGKEFSLMAFVHEENVYPMITARDHKRAYDNDEGRNTGGMGAYAPVADVSTEDIDYTTETILKRAATGLVKEGRPFTGILYAGLIMTKEGPKTIEYNTRFGDPETQVVLPLLKNDLLQVLQDVIEGIDPKLEWANDACVGIVLAANGYPLEKCQVGIPLPKFELDEDCFTIYAGAKQSEQELVSDGGRILLVGAKDVTLEQAAKRAYNSLKSVSMKDDFFYRTDIGKN